MRIGPERAARGWVWRSIHAAGGRLAFGTDWPVIDFERTVNEIGELGLKEDVMKKLFWENAVRVYGLEEWV